MATIIDALVVSLNLDASKFKAGQKGVSEDLRQAEQHANRTAKAIAESGKVAAAIFTRIRNEAAGLFLVLAGASGLKSFVAGVNSTVAATGYLAKQIGIGTGELYAWQKVLERSGGTADDAASSLSGLSQAFAAFQTSGVGMEKMSAILDRFHLSAKKAGSNEFKSPAELAMEIGARMQYLPQAQQIQIGSQIGLTPGFSTAIADPKFRGKMAEAYKLGVPSDDDYRAAVAYENALSKIKQAFESLDMAVVTKLEPFITALTDMLTKWIGSPEARQALKDFTDALIRFCKYLIQDVEFRQVQDALTSFADKLEWFVRKILTMAGAMPEGGPTQQEQQEYDKSGPSTLRRLGSALGLASPLPPGVEDEVRRQAALKGLDPEHMVELARVEHGGYDKTSPAGAMGPMQLMPSTAADLSAEGPAVNPHDWKQNIEGGTRYYQKLLKKFRGNYEAADAAYNAGPNSEAVQNFYETGKLSVLPNETQNYVATISGALKSRRPVDQLIPKAGDRFKSSMNSTTTNSTSTSEVAINTINIQTQATDAKGIAGSLQRSLQNLRIAGQMNSGLA